MRPLHLTFAGLRSYRAQADIAFSELDLFAVIGDTGAGKSTIIEALSLALYARKTWTGGASLEDMIADGEKTLRVEFTFAVGDQVWQVTRSRNRSTTPGVNKLVCLTGTEHIDGAGPVTTRVTELIGLDHSQFTRAVVLPQGRFDELLRSTPAVRNKLLGSILGLDDVRRVGLAADTLARRWEKTLVEASTTRGLLPADPAGALVRAEALATAAESRRVSLQAFINNCDATATIVASLQSALHRLETASTAIPAAEGSPWVPALEAAHDAAERLGAVQRDATDEAERCNERLRELAIATTATLNGFETRDAAVGSVSALTAASTALAEATEALVTAETKVEQLVANPPAAAVAEPLIAAEAEALAVRAAATQAMRAAEAEAVAAARSWDDLAAATAVLETSSQSETAARTTIEAVVATAEQATEAALARALEVERAEQGYDEAVARQAAVVAAEHCQPGDPCPICERVLPDTFTAPVAANAIAAQKALRAAKAEESKARDAATDAARDRTHAEGQLASAIEALSVARVAVEAALLVAEGAGVDLTADTREAATARHTAAASSAAEALKVAEESFSLAHDVVVAARAAVDAARTTHERELAASRKEVEAVRKRVAAHEAAVASLPPAWRPDGPVDAAALREAAARIDGMLETLAVLERDRVEVDTARVTAEATVARVRTELAELVIGPAQRTVHALNSRLGRVRDLADAVNATLQSCELEGFEPIDGPTDLPGSVSSDELLRTITEANDRIVAADGVLATAADVTGKLTTDHELARTTLSKLLADAGYPDVGAIREAAGSADAQAEAARIAADAAKAAVDQAAALDRILDIARPFVANLNVLATAMRDQHFIGHLIKSREVELLAEASRRLRSITNGRFGFVSNFGVVSIASGEVRTPDSLSGGERFQAALALALALVEIASRGGGTLDAVFVDEGFGSLDSNALEMALQTLGTVAGGGKMVALISHLRPVAEYVETVLHVTKDDMFGSKITLLDPEARDRLLVDDIRSGLTA